MNRTVCERSSPHIIEGKNNVSTNIYHLPPKIIQNVHGTGEYSGRTHHDSVDNIIKMYEEEKFITEDTEFINSEHHFHNKIELKCHQNIPWSSRNKDKHISEKPHQTVDSNINPCVTYKERNNTNNKKIEFCEQTGLTSKEKVCVDKTTYCRPVISLYNEEFIHRTMERNSKLKKLVKRLAIARQREKENVSWNNYINELKNKHGTNFNDPRWKRAPQLGPEQYITPDIIDDCYNTKFSRQQSNPCRHLLQDLYEGYNDPLLSTPTYTDRRSHDNIRSQSNCYSLPYYNNSNCYLTSSQGRLIALERERRKHEYLNRRYNHPSMNFFKNINYHEIKKISEKNLYGKQYLKDSFKPNKDANFTQNIENAASQTGFYFKENIRRNKATNKSESKILIHEFIQAFESDEKVEENHQDLRNDKTAVTLVNIETKLATLIDCVNSFIHEIKLERKIKLGTKAVSVSRELNDVADQNTNTITSNTVGNFDKPLTDDIFYGEIFNDGIESTDISNFYPCTVPKKSEIADIMKEIDKFCSKDRLYKSQPCSVNITFEVPTRDCCTEVTKSLSKQNLDNKKEEIEEVSTEAGTFPQMTIAVNTDPFNFLSLIRISMEALTHLLSSVPSINYQSYLSFLPFPQTTRRMESHYTCNICGAAFTKPSALSDHIQGHNLGKTRDCCVCRHVLDRICRCGPGRLFSCRHCGQRFTRAYCRELHQLTCAGAREHLHDVRSSLVVLR